MDLFLYSTPFLGISILFSLVYVHHRALLAIGSFCTMRTSEVFGLTWGAYFGDTLLVKSTAWEGQFFEDRTKTDSSRALVTVPASVRPWMKSGGGNVGSTYVN